ncbi:spidroin-2-like [Lutra lutra]|uniref:spidroin-2-like n=1 Tax=Lutra lutra TaxID=9657 RepID=UPI001FD47EFB|nr:spidroin-2-like [Lutra lutra]
MTAAAAAALRGAGIGGPGPGAPPGAQQPRGGRSATARRARPVPEEPSVRPAARTPGRIPRAACAPSAGSPREPAAAAEGREWPREAGRDRGAGPAGPQGQARSRANRQCEAPGHSSPSCQPIPLPFSMLPNPREWILHTETPVRFHTLSPGRTDTPREGDSDKT